MKTRYLLIALFALQFFAACDHFEKHVKKVEVVVEDTELVSIDEEKHFAPPPPGYPLPKPTTLQEWFSGICDTAKLTNTTCQFLMFGTAKVYMIALVDPVILKEKKDRVGVNYATLSKTEYANMDWPQIFGKVRTQLKEFSTSDKFKKSPLAKAGGITIRFPDNEVLQLK